MSSDDQISSLLSWISCRTDEFYEDAPCGLLFTLPDGLILKANRTFAEWLEYTKDELLTQKRFQDVLTVGCKIYYETHYSPLLRIQGFLNEVTLDLRGKNEKSVPVLINSSEIKDEAGKVILIRSTVFNISDRRNYEKELLSARHRAENSEKRFRFLADAGEILRKSFDYRANFEALAQLATRSFCDAFCIELISDTGLNRIAEAHRFSGKLIPTEPFDRLEDTYWQPQLIQDVKNISSAELEIQSLLTVPILLGGSRLGRLRFYMIELGRRFSEEDLELALELSRRCAGAIETANLHSETVKTADDLRESHEWFSTTLRSIGDAVIAVNTDKTISFMNQVAASLTGWTPSEAISRPMDEVFKIVHDKTGDLAFNPVDQALREGVVVGLEKYTALIRKDGSKKIIEDSAAPIKLSNGKVSGVVLVFRDVTEKHAQEEDRQETLEALQEEREIREKFVATLTHDLRSPITAVKMSAQLILRKSDQPATVQAQAVRVINSVNRADQMIQDLLDANRIRAGETIPLVMASCELAAEIKEALVDLTTIHGERFLYEGEAELRGVWNCGALRRVVENLCNNAIKYGAPHSPVTVRLKKRGNCALLSVHNEGPPIPTKDQANLFELYKRAASAHTGGQRGWGLGLTLVRGVAEAHGGQVSLESSNLHGTTFTVSLPLDAGAEQPGRKK